jgi:SNF family Na+-dependent transporter
MKGCPKLFESLHKKWKGLGLIPIFVAFNMSTYYNLIESYSFNYLFLSFISPLPWDKIDPKTGSILNKVFHYIES